MKYGAKLKQLRLARNLTLQMVADALNIGKSTLSEYERDIHAPTLNTLSRLLDFYCVDKDSFIIAGKIAINMNDFSDVGIKEVFEIQKREIAKKELNKKLKKF